MTTLEYVQILTDTDHIEADANTYAEKGWRVVSVITVTPARWRMLLERPRRDEKGRNIRV